MNDQKQLAEVFARFAVAGKFQAAEGRGGGLINTNWRVTTADGPEYFLQRLNRRVFPRPDQVMENVIQVTAHLRSRAQPTLEFLPLIEDPAAYLHTDSQGEAWRLCRFFTGVVTRQVPAGGADVEAAGRGYGGFLKNLADFPAQSLHRTLPGFHDTTARWVAFLQAHHEDRWGRSQAVQPELDALVERGDLAQGLVRLDLPTRVVHNDAKLSNVLLDASSGRAACVVDLDTVMPGTALHDFGDMMRTMCCTAGEEEIDLEKVQVDPDLLAALTEGWLAEVDAVLAPAERLNLLPAGLVITFEQAVRFLTDYLLGDSYYQTTRPDQNLDRCRNQLRLLETMVERREELAAVLP